MEENGNFDSLYPFFILILVALVNFLKKRGAKKKEKAYETPRVRPRDPPSPVPLPTFKKVAPPPKEKEVDPPPPRPPKKRVSRIAKLVRSKKELVLLSEILQKDCL